MIVYIATNLVNSKKYIGKTIGSFTRRKKAHIDNALQEKLTTYFHRAIKKYGVDNFKWEIVYQGESDDDIIAQEKYWIKFYKTNVKRYGYKYGYNLTDGGEGTSGHVPSIETRKKLSNAGKRRKLTVVHRKRIKENHIGFLGKHHSEKSKQKIVESLTGRKHTEATKQKMREKRKLQIMKPVTAETRKKMSEASKGKVSPRKGKRNVYSKKTQARSGCNNSMYGKKHSEESKRKQREAALRRSAKQKEIMIEC